MEKASAISKQDKKLSSQFISEVPNEIVEEQTKKIPNLVFLGLGLLSMVGSAMLAARKKPAMGTFVGQWVPTMLIFGVYNKIVKLEDELLSRKTKSKMH